MSLGEKIQSLRKQNGLSQEKLADLLNVSRQAVSKWELNDSQPDIGNIVQLSRFLNVSTDYLLKDEEPVPQTPVSHRLPLVQLFAFCLTVLSAGGILALCIIGSVKDCTVSISSGDAERIYTGIIGFLMYSNLTWLLILCAAACLAGLAMLICPYRHRLTARFSVEKKRS